MADENITLEVKEIFNSEELKELPSNKSKEIFLSPKVEVGPDSDEYLSVEDGEITTPTTLNEIKNNILVKHADPLVKALTSVKSWEELEIPEDLLKGLYAKAFMRPSRIQEQALPLILKSKYSLIAQAQNGSGKTATFALAMLAKTIRDIPNPQSVCLCHTRELAQQNLDVIKELGKFTEITTWLAVPQCTPYNKRLGAQILVGTPGKLREMIMKHVFPTKSVSLFILDEADVLMDYTSNMAAQVTEIRKSFPNNTQLLLFSATYPERVRKFASAYLPNANSIKVKQEELTLSAISQFFIRCENDAEKISVLSDLYGCMTIGQSVIFVGSRKVAFSLASQMTHEGHAISLICGSQNTGPEKMDLETRERIMTEFRSGETKVLIATDLLSRGIDVPQVTLVVNFNLPKNFRHRQFSGVDFETYIHRIGRTGRFGLKGLAISLVDPLEEQLLQQIQQFYSCTVTPLENDPEKIEKILKELRS